MRGRLVALTGAVVVALTATAVASASRTQDTLICGDVAFPVTVTSTSNENSVAWGVGTVSAGEHFIPTSFSGAGVDLTTDETLFSFSQAKGGGNGQHNQEQMACTTPTVTATAGELGIPGVDPGDLIQISFSATVVRKGG
jgi:hypothetical protein